MTADAARERAALRRRLRRSERLRKGQAALLLAPLCLFLLVFFLMPIAGMLVRSVDNPELRAVMPQTAARIREWDGAGLPNEQTFASFAAELRQAYDARMLAIPAKREIHTGRAATGFVLAFASIPLGLWLATLETA